MYRQMQMSKRRKDATQLADLEVGRRGHKPRNVGLLMPAF